MRLDRTGSEKEAAPGFPDAACVRGQSGLDGPFVDLRQVGDVLVYTRYPIALVPDGGPPVGLDRDTFVDHNTLQLAHHLATLV